MFLRAKRKDKKSDSAPSVSPGHQIIQPEDLIIVQGLGEGQYGIVELGKWKPPNAKDEILVAVKSIKDTGEEQLREVLMEVNTMQRLSHDNIVKLFGVTLPSRDTEQLKLITEYAAYGSLEDNLLKKERDICLVSSFCKFAMQVAHGMNYLAKQNLVHRDLSARNILVFTPTLVKVSDFGLARSLEGRAAQITVHRKMAIAWLPPEAIMENQFMLSSDVWSYGITLWEMFSFGQTPWAEMSPLQIKMMLVNEPDKHLLKPDACPDGFYDVMLSCWKRDAKERPPFEEIFERVSKLQPKEAITKVTHNTKEEGHLSYKNKVKVTVIRRIEDGMLYVESEFGNIGLVHEKNLDFNKKALQRHASNNPTNNIGRPFNFSRKDPKQAFSHLQKDAAATPGKTITGVVEDSGAKNLMDFGDDIARDPTNPLSPDRSSGHPGINHGNMPQATTAKRCPKYISMSGRKLAPECVPEETLSLEEDYMSMDHQNRVPQGTNGGEYAMLKEDARPSPGTHLESEAHGLETEVEYAIPYSTRKDRSGLTVNPSHGLSLSWNQSAGTHTLEIPPRLDPHTNTINTTGASTSFPSERELSSSPFGTTPRKKPVPTPRKKKSQSASDDFSDTNRMDDTNSSDTNDDFPRRSNSESSYTPVTQNGTHESPYKKVPPPVPVPYHCSKRMPKTIEDRSNEVGLGEIAELSLEGRPDVGDEDENEFPLDLQDLRWQADLRSEQPVKNKHYITIKTPVPNGESFTFPNPQGQELCSGPQTATSTVEGSLGAAFNDYLTQDHVYENAKTLKPSPGNPRDLSPNGEGNFEDTQPIYDKPLNLPMPPEIPPQVLNQPPPSPNDLFGGPNHQPPVFAGWENAPGTNDWPYGVEHMNAVNQPPILTAQFDESHEPFNPVGPANPVQPVDPATQPDDQVQTAEEGTYGEESDGRIREIRQVCGEELARDWCYAALLQYQGDVEQVVRMAKTQKLSKITGKSEGFCERTLTHCSWNLNRAAEYIIENFENKEV
ncbi:ack-related non-receptor tyrosine kinase-like [Stylophora pistillata]|uniref:Tyrosine-protein kinase PR2 n=1 Tax=Stylophora pistillata TaxID=50429 RepID=A0A2B4S4R2_STYPI|nr:ack-related non-receptor tyrosine kinase-like [Stylophora pistillata]PFX24039.1 Tyrosine-protein kinase PR2 [Stylophora pistillata]